MCVTAHSQTYQAHYRSYLLNDQQYPIYSKQQNGAQLRLEPTF